MAQLPALICLLKRSNEQDIIRHTDFDKAADVGDVGWGLSNCLIFFRLWKDKTNWVHRWLQEDDYNWWTSGHQWSSVRFNAVPVLWGCHPGSWYRSQSWLSGATAWRWRWVYSEQYDRWTSPARTTHTQQAMSKHLQAKLQSFTTHHCLSALVLRLHVTDVNITRKNRAQVLSSSLLTVSLTPAGLKDSPFALQYEINLINTLNSV